MNNDRDELATKALMSEVDALRKSSESLLFSFDRVFGFAVALVVGGLGVGVTAGHTIVLAFIPCPLAIFYLHLLGLNIEGLSRAGHKRFLEEKLNGILGSSYLEEPYVAPTRQGKTRLGRPGVFLTQASVAVVLLAVSVVGFFAVLSFGLWYVILYVVSLALPIVGLVASALELGRAYELAYNAAKSAPDQPNAGGQLPHE
jgi:hypothetical protein